MGILLISKRVLKFSPNNLNDRDVVKAQTSRPRPGENFEVAT